MNKQTGAELITTLEGFFKKAPSLPTNAKEIIVKLTPWLALIFGVLTVLAGVSMLTLSPVAAVARVSAGPLFMLTGILTTVAGVFMVLAFPKTKKREISGWTLLFWSEALSFVVSFLSLSVVGVIQSLLMAAIAFYLLFQIKSFYK